MDRHTAVALAAVLVGGALLSVPAFVHSHAAHSGHVSFQVWTDDPPRENASWGSPTTVNASVIPDPVLAEIRDAAAGDGGGGVITHAETIDGTLSPAFQSAEESVYVRDDGTWYRLDRTYDAGGFVDGALILEGVSFVAGLVIVALGGWFGVFGRE